MEEEVKATINPETLSSQEPRKMKKVIKAIAFRNFLILLNIRHLSIRYWDIKRKLMQRLEKILRTYYSIL